jgi:hypothetical protein
MATAASNSDALRSGSLCSSQSLERLSLPRLPLGVRDWELNLDSLAVRHHITSHLAVKPEPRLLLGVRDWELNLDLLADRHYITFP